MWLSLGGFVDARNNLHMPHLFGGFIGGAATPSTKARQHLLQVRVVLANSRKITGVQMNCVT